MMASSRFILTGPPTCTTTTSFGGPSPARAYKITGEDRYLKKAKASFDYVYDNFHDDTLGGGLYWINRRTSKNSCLNSPAVIAAVRLSVLLKDAAYLEKAKSLYAWQKKTLTDGTGKVFDSIRRGRGGAPQMAASR